MENETGIRTNGTGTLYVVATPIGNLSDLTFRAAEILKQVDSIACEDTRRTLKLLSHYGVSKPLVTIFGPKERRETPKLLKLLAQSRSVALLTDAGTPGISDPGGFIVREARRNGFRVEPVPGCSALSCAVSLSGLCDNGFVFLGFLHRRKGRMKKEFSTARIQGKAIAFFESPFRIAETLDTACVVLGKDCECWLGRELTKKFEEQISGNLGEVAEKIGRMKILGEVTVVLKPKQPEKDERVS